MTGDRVLGSFHIAGNFVAYTASGSTASTETIEAVDLARGRMTLRDRVPSSGVPDLVIANSGSLAWIRNDFAGAAIVVTYEAGVGKTVLDPGPAVGRDSLALGGPSFDRPSDTVYWTTPSGPRSAPLTPPAVTCANFPNQAAAQLADNTRDVDGDGIYCASLPCPCAGAARRRP